jgi:hypothetical protein
MHALHSPCVPCAQGALCSRQAAEQSLAAGSQVLLSGIGSGVRPTARARRAHVALPLGATACVRAVSTVSILPRGPVGRDRDVEFHRNPEAALDVANREPGLENRCRRGLLHGDKYRLARQIHAIGLHGDMARQAAHLHQQVERSGEASLQPTSLGRPIEESITGLALGTGQATHHAKRMV